MKNLYFLKQLFVVVVILSLLLPDFLIAGQNDNVNCNYPDLLLQQSQTYTVYGKVTSEAGTVLPLVNVYLKGTTIGASSDFEGKYIIENITEPTVTIVAKFTGFETFEKTISFSGEGKLNLNIVLKESTQLLDQIVVTGTTNPKTKLESSVAITTINTKEMDQRVAQNNADLLKAIPGLWVESSGGDGPANVWVRGFPQSGGYIYLGLMEDGLPIFQAGYNSMPSPDQFYKTDLTIKSVEAIRGGSAPIVMQGAAGAVINYISKTGTRNFKGIARFMYNPLYGSERVDLNLGGPMGKDFYYDFGGFYRIGKGPYDYGYNANKGGQIKGNIVKRFKNGFIRLNLRYINDKVNWNLPFPYIFHKDGSLGEIPGFSLKKAGAALNEVDTKYTLNLPDGSSIDGNLQHGFDTRLFSVGFELFFDLGNDWTITNKFRLDRSNQQVNSDMAVAVVPLDPTAPYYYTDGTQVQDVANLNGNGLSMPAVIFNTNTDYDNVIDRVAVKKEWKNNNLTMSFEYFNYHTDGFLAQGFLTKEVKNAPRILIKGNPNVPPIFPLAYVSPDGINRSSGTENTYSVFFTDEYNISKHFRLDLGFRYDYKNIKGKVASVVGAPAVPPVNGPGYSFGDDIPFDDAAGNWAATVGINYKINKTSALFARGSRGYNGKKLGDYTAISADFDELKNLEDRAIYQAELGYKYGSSKFAVFASLIYASVHNAVGQIFIPTPKHTLVRQQVILSTRTYSAEVEVQYIPVKNLLLKLTTTLQNALYTDLSFTAPDGTIVEGQEFDWSGNHTERYPAAMIDITASYNIKKFNVFANYRYYSNRWSTPANNVKLKGFGELYGGVGYEIVKGLTIEAKGANLTNTVALTSGNVRGDQFVSVDQLDGKPWLGRRNLPISVFFELSYRFGKK